MTRGAGHPENPDANQRTRLPQHKERKIFRKQFLLHPLLLPFFPVTSQYPLCLSNHLIFYDRKSHFHKNFRNKFTLMPDLFRIRREHRRQQPVIDKGQQFGKLFCIFRPDRTVTPTLLNQFQP